MSDERIFPLEFADEKKFREWERQHFPNDHLDRVDAILDYVRERDRIVPTKFCDLSKSAQNAIVEAALIPDGDQILVSEDVKAEVEALIGDPMRIRRARLFMMRKDMLRFEILCRVNPWMDDGTSKIWFYPDGGSFRHVKRNVPALDY